MLGRPRHNPSVEARASAPAATLKLHFHRIAPLQGRVMRTKPERAQVSRAEKRKVTKTALSEEVKASAPAAIPKLHFHRTAGLQERGRKLNPQRASRPAKKATSSKDTSVGGSQSERSGGDPQTPLPPESPSSGKSSTK